MAKSDIRRWRLILGGGKADGTGIALGNADKDIDLLLNKIYGTDSLTRGAAISRKGGTGSSNLSLSRWLGDIRRYFPDTVVRVMQQDAIAQVGLLQILNEPELMAQVETNVQLVAAILSMQHLLPQDTRESARSLVREVTDKLVKTWEPPFQKAIRGAVDRSSRSQKPRHHEIDWERTIRANLKHYQDEYRTVIPEQLIGYGRKARVASQEIILCVDQSGSMASSVVYASIFGAVMASIPALKTQFIVFDTTVVDLTAELEDPTDLLFGTQLGGGTDIGNALLYAQQMITRPSQTTLVLITDLFEGGPSAVMRERMKHLNDIGVQLIVLLALNDEGSPGFNDSEAQYIANLGIPAFACTPDQFPDMMAAALEGDQQKLLRLSKSA